MELLWGSMRVRINIANCLWKCCTILLPHLANAETCQSSLIFANMIEREKKQKFLFYSSTDLDYSSLFFECFISRFFANSWWLQFSHKVDRIIFRSHALTSLHYRTPALCSYTTCCLSQSQWVPATSFQASHSGCPFFLFPEWYTLKTRVTTPSSSSQIGSSRVTLSKTLPVRNLFGELMSWKDNMAWGYEESLDPCGRVRLPLIGLRGRFHAT